MALELPQFGNAPGTFNPAATPNLLDEIDRSNAILRESAGVQYRGQLANIERQGQAKLQQQSNTLKQLSAFSETAFKTLEAYQKRKDEESEAEYLAMARNNEVGAEWRAANALNDAQETAASASTNSLGREAMANGASPASAMQMMQFMSTLRGAKRRGYMKGYLQDRAQDYAMLVSNESKRLQALDPAEQAAAIKQLRKQYMIQNGLLPSNGVDPGLYIAEFDDKVVNIENNILAKGSNVWTQNQSEDKEQRALLAYQATGNFNQLFSELQGTVDGNGAVRSNSEIWDIVYKYHGENSSPEEIRDWAENNADPAFPEKSIYQARKKQIDNLVLKARQKQETEFKLNEAENDRAFDTAEDMALQELGDPNNPPTDADIDAVQVGLWGKYRRRSSKLDELKKGFTLDAQQRKEVEEKIQRKAELGILTPQDLQHLPWEIQKQWSSVAQQQSSAPKGETKAQLDAIESAVWNLPQIKASPNGKLDPVAQLVVGGLQNEFRRRYSQYLQQGMPSASAAEQAGAEMVDYFNKSQGTPGGKYFVDPKTGKFNNFMQGGNWSGGAKAYLGRITTIKQVLDTVGWNGAISSPGLFLTEAEAKSLGSSGVFQVPPLVQYYSNKYNRNPLEIINAQRKAMGMPEFDLTPSIKAVQGLDPRVQGLINRFPSQNRLVRATGGSGGFQGFEASLVPNGLGKVIEKAAKANGLDPALLAGLLDHESAGFNPDVIAGRRLSSAGAVGIAQIMPQDHPGVNPRDPVASINYAAKYLNQLRTQFGSLNKAIYAYNAGPGNVERYGGPIPGDSESQNYLKNVLKATAKYRNNPELWSSGLLGRGRFRVIEHLTGDRTHGNYRSDHGGGNYHEHIAFQTQQERDQAIKLYKSLGYRVTSVDRNDGGYHGAGLAIDVAPPLDLPYDKISEAEWSRQARAVIGL